MKSKFLYVILTVTAIICLFAFSASAGYDLSADELLELDKVTSLYHCVGAGDTNNDGMISSDDARFILRLAVNLETADTALFSKCDIDEDGSVTSDDARLALRYAVGLESLPGHTLTEIVIVPPTCGTEGITVKICTTCFKLYATITVPPTEKQHITLGWTTTQEANCVNTGKAEMICINCNQVIKSVEIPATREHSGEWNYPNGKSCLDPVEKNRTCTVCGIYEEKTENPPGGHNFKWFTEKENTCTEDGYDEYRCAHCGLVSRGIVTKAHGHLFEHDIEIKQATCTEYGIVGDVCVYCEATRNEAATAALGHNYDNKHYKVTKEPDCAETGTADVICTTCGEAAVMILPTIEHTLTDGWTEVKAAGCTEDGEMSGVCRYCGPVSKTVPATGHNLTTWVNVKPATCAEPGILQGACSICGDTSATKEIPLKNHDFDTSVLYWTSGILCQENGVGHYKCKNCPAMYQKPLLQRPCNNTNGKQTRVVSEATCTNAMVIVDVCDFCGNDISGSEISSGKALGHSFDETVWTETKPASCDKNGERICECTRCDEGVKKEIIPAYGHTPGEEIETKAPSCSEYGELSLMCETCSGVISTTLIDKTAHTHKNTIITDSEAVDEDGNLIVKVRVECSVCNELISEEEPVTRIAVDTDGLNVKFDSASRLAPDGIVSFTITNPATEMFIMITWGIDGFEELSPDSNGVYSFRIPADIDATEKVTIIAVTMVA